MPKTKQNHRKYSIQLNHLLDRIRTEVDKRPQVLPGSPSLIDEFIAQMEKVERDLADSRRNHIDANTRNIQACDRAERLAAALTFFVALDEGGDAWKVYARKRWDRTHNWKSTDAIRADINQEKSEAIAALAEKMVMCKCGHDEDYHTRGYCRHCGCDQFTPT